jgi:ABC-2 type transport system ATP-binding protein
MEKRDALSGELSRGMRQKLAICCGYLHQPRVVLLDEPLTGLDPHGIRTMKKSIAAHALGGTAFIISSHLLSLIEDLCTSVLVLHRGQRLLHGKLADLRRQAAADGRNETLEDLFFRLMANQEQPVTVEQSSVSITFKRGTQERQVLLKLGEEKTPARAGTVVGILNEWIRARR